MTIHQPTRPPETPSSPQPSTRRRRLLVTAVSAAVAVVVAVPIALQGGDFFGDSTAPAPSSSPTPTGGTTSSGPTPSTLHSPSSSPSTQPVTAALDVTHLRVGAVPALGYLHRGLLHLPGGDIVTPATRAPVVAFARTRDGATAYLTERDTTFGVEIALADGTRLGPFAAGYGLALNADRTIVAWLSPAGTPQVWQAGLTAPRSLGSALPGNSHRLAAVTGHDCSTATGCTVYASSWQGSPRAWAVAGDGRRAQADPAGRLVGVHDATDQGWLVGYTRITDSGSRSGVIDEAAPGRPLRWSTSRHTLDTFSPGQDYLLAGPAYRDGIGDSLVAVYDVDGRLLTDRRMSAQHPGFVQSARWEDATHVLVTVFQRSHWSVVRLSVDGSLEYAVPPVRGSEMRGPFVLETTP